MTWVIAIASLGGLWLNIEKRVACFYVWAVTNAAWMAVDFDAGLHGQAALQAIYFALSIYGIARWGRDRGRRDTAKSRA